MCLGLLLSAAALMAQQQSREIPTAEWISHSLYRMQEKGLLVGWDPMGHRPAGPFTRIEIAAVTYIAYTNVKKTVIRIQDRMFDLRQAGESARSELEAIREEAAALSHLHEDVLDLHKLSRLAHEELIQLGADPFAIERDLIDLAPLICLPADGLRDSAGNGIGQRQTRSRTSAAALT
jgi:hypothetical protein